MNDKPPSSKVNLGFRARTFSTPSSLAKRLAGIRELWMGDWRICPIRGTLSNRCHTLFIYLQS